MWDEWAYDYEVHIHQAHGLQIWRLRAEGGRTYLGRSAVCRGITAEGRAIGPDRAVEVSKGRISRASGEGPNGPARAG